MRPINQKRVRDWFVGFRAAMAMHRIPWPSSLHLDMDDDDDDCVVKAVFFGWFLPRWTVWAGRSPDGMLFFEARMDDPSLTDCSNLPRLGGTLPYAPETLRALLVEASRATAGDDRLEAMKQILQQRRSL